MASVRATKSGLNRETQAKLDAKYDAGLAETCMEWMKMIINENTAYSEDFSTDGSVDNVAEVLNDGNLLAKLANGLEEGTVKDAKLQKRQTMAFKKMEMIGIFLSFAEKYGVPDPERFQTVDLYEKQNMAQVIICLQSVARKAHHKGKKGFGPKESTENRRTFTEEQLKAGQGVIGLQMGTNKGASQAGMNMGKARKIVD